MATKAELQAKLDALADRNEAAIANVKAAIEDLKVQIAQGGNLDLDFSRLDAAAADLENADGVDGPDGPTPAEEPVV